MQGEEGRSGEKLVFSESYSDEYIRAVDNTCGVLRFVSDALYTDPGGDRRLQDLMPHPLNTREHLFLCCLRGISVSDGTLHGLVKCFGRLEELAEYPLLGGFLAQRHLVARHFLMAPALAVFGEELSRSWKKQKGYGKNQSWIFLEHSEGSVREWMPQLLPRSCASRSPAQVARLLDRMEKLADAFVTPSDTGDCTIADVKACGIFNEEWVSDDPLALVALELINSEATLRKAEREPRPAKEPSGSYKTIHLPMLERSYSPERLKEPHSLRFASITLIGLRLLELYIQAARCGEALELPQLYCMLKNFSGLTPADTSSPIEDLLDDARELLKSGQVCDCCIGCFKAIVECAGAFSLRLAGERLPELARDVLRNWKDSSRFYKPWVETPDPPFPAPILDEIETRYAPGDREARRSPPPSLEQLVRQFHKAKAHGLVKNSEEYEDPVLRTSVQVLEKAEKLEHEIGEEVVESQAAEFLVMEDGRPKKLSSEAGLSQKALDAMAEKLGHRDHELEKEDEPVIKVASKSFGFNQSRKPTKSFGMKWKSPTKFIRNLVKAF